MVFALTILLGPDSGLQVNLVEGAPFKSALTASRGSYSPTRAEFLKEEKKMSFKVAVIYNQKGISP